MKGLLPLLRTLIQREEILFPSGLLAVAILSHRDWFFSGQVIAVGDWPYLWPPWMRGFIGPPIAWMSEFDLGYYNGSAASHIIQSAMGVFSAFGLNYSIIERLFFFWPAALLPGIGMYFFSKDPLGRAGGTAAGLVYQLNTAALFYGGAHLNQAVAYALVPALLLFMRGSVRRGSFRNAVAAGIVMSLILAYEPRLGYIIGWVAAAYLLFLLASRRNKKIQWGIVATIIGIPLAVHGYWLIAAFLYPSEAFSTVPRKLFIPFITLPYSLALYDPFWSGGMLATFDVQPIPWFAYLLPIVAFMSLATKRPLPEQLLFAAIGVIGVFLAKQDNPPSGEIYAWLFTNFPGFLLFRESSKFFLLTALGYSVLVGTFVHNSARRLAKPIPFLSMSRLSPKRQSRIGALLVLLAIAGSVAPSQAAFANTLGYAYSTSTVPQLYYGLETLVNDGSFSRVLWFMTYPTFGFRSNEHPAVNALTFYSSYQDLLPKGSNLRLLLNALSIKYVILTDDTAYPTDPTFNFLREWYKSVTNGTGLQQVTGFAGATVFKNSDALPQVYTTKLNLSQLSNSTAVLQAPKLGMDINKVAVNEYRIKLQPANGNLVVLSEGFDSNWILIAGSRTIRSTRVMGLLNGFVIGNLTTDDATILYQPQVVFNWGFILSLATLVLSTIFVLHPYDPRAGLSWFKRALHTKFRK
jgi:hypothetical protein